MINPFKYCVKVPNSPEERYGHDTIEWILDRNLQPNRDFEIDMHGGQRDYVSFYFKDRKLAIHVTLVRS